MRVGPPTGCRIVDGEFCCPRPAPLPRARQAKRGDGADEPLGEEPEVAPLPPVLWWRRAFGPWRARLEDVEKVVRLRASDWLLVSGGS